MTRTFIVDLAERAGKTFVQAFVGVLSTAYLAGALTDIADINAWKKLLGAAVAAGVAALASFVTSTLSGLKTGTASASKAVAETAVASTGQVVTATQETTVGPAALS